VEFDLIKGPKGLQAANVSGPNGISVKGDPNAPGSNKRISKWVHLFNLKIVLKNKQNWIKII
jgi:hypothetical protein